MKNLLTRPALTVFFACLLVVSMIVSPFLLSVSMWGLVAVALWESALVSRAEGRADNLRTLRAWLEIMTGSFRRLFRHPEYALFLLLLFAPALSFFWSSDRDYWLERTRVRLPFLVLPWVFANLPALSSRQFRLVLYVLVWAMTLICVGAAVYFAFHVEDAVVGIGRGIPIAVPRSHIRFSLILAIAIVAGAWLWFDGYYWRRRWERHLLGISLVFLFLFIHLLSVRSGIAALYAVLLFSVGRYVWQTRRWSLGVIALIVMGIIPFVAMNTMPSFRTRVYYMLWDWQQYRQDAGNTYSDAERMISLRVGWQLWREYPLLGVGAGDLPAAVQRVVDDRYPQYGDAPKLPHNQFLYIMAGTGVLGLALSLPAFFTPLWNGRRRQYYLLSTFQILAFSSFLVEYTIETAIGVAFYLFYTLWFMKMAEEDKGGLARR